MRHNVIVSFPFLPLSPITLFRCFFAFLAAAPLIGPVSFRFVAALLLPWSFRPVPPFFPIVNLKKYNFLY